MSEGLPAVLVYTNNRCPLFYSHNNHNNLVLVFNATLTSLVNSTMKTRQLQTFKCSLGIGNEVAMLEVLVEEMQKRIEVLKSHTIS